jgi:hypothetical protein
MPSQDILWQSQTHLNNHSDSHSDNSVRNSLLLSEQDLEYELLKYVPRRDFSKLTVAASDTPPRAERYEVLDRVPDNDGVPAYMIRRVETPKSTKARTNRTSNIAVSSRTQSGRTSSDGSREQSRARGTPPTPIPLLSTQDYDVNDASILKISLFDIENYVSAREIERFENERYEHPHADDLPHRTPTASLSGSASGRRSPARGVGRPPARLAVREKRPSGRPPKRKRMNAVVVVPAAMAPPPAQNSVPALDASGSEGECSFFSAAEQNEDAPMVESIEEDIYKGEVGAAPALQGTPKKFSKFGMMLPPTTRSTTAESSSASASSRKHSPRNIPIVNYKIDPPLPKWAHRSPFSNREVGVSESVPNQPHQQRSRGGSESSLSASRRNVEVSEHIVVSHKLNLPSPVALSPTKPAGATTVEEENEEEEYEISHVISHDDSTGTRFYLVGWVGYSDAEATWLSEDELQGAQEVLGVYLDNLARLENEIGGRIK